MSKIIKLSEQISNMIAAGEVVERPMGVVKELVENAIDAEATVIEVRIREGGIQAIEVIDNGCGMSQEDAVRAFERHATSKIRQIDDLWSIHTLGFRGEAIPSIASVSKLTLITSDGNEHTKVAVEYGKMTEARPFPAKPGTHITVEGLFYKTPARLKHLKSVNAEGAAIADVMEKFAMSHPEIAFTLVVDGAVRFQTTGSGQIEEIVYKLYGKEAAEQAVPLHKETYDFTIDGMLVLPHITRANKYYMSVFINGRMIRHYKMQRAILDGYRGYLASDRYPICIIQIKLDDSLVDVNVHPSKWEVRLSKEQKICQTIAETISETLYHKMRVIEAEPIAETKRPRQTIDVLSFMEQLDEPVMSESEPLVYAKSSVKEQTMQPNQSVCEETHQAYASATGKEGEDFAPAEQKEESSASEATIPALQVIGQLHGKYILAQGPDGLYIIDQHAAQEKVHYEQFQQALENGQFSMQPLLVPVVLEIRGSDAARLDAINEKLAAIGVHMEPFGGQSVCCREVPTWMQGADIKAVLEDLIDMFEKRTNYTVQELKKDAVATLACHSSIRFNRYLTHAEMEKVIAELRTCKQPFHCPHGRPTLIKITEKQLLKEFKRV